MDLAEVPDSKRRRERNHSQHISGGCSCRHIRLATQATHNFAGRVHKVRGVGVGWGRVSCHGEGYINGSSSVVGSASGSTNPVAAPVAVSCLHVSVPGGARSALLSTIKSLSPATCATYWICEDTSPNTDPRLFRKSSSIHIRNESMTTVMHAHTYTHTHTQTRTEALESQALMPLKSFHHIL